MSPNPSHDHGHRLAPSLFTKAKLLSMGFQGAHIPDALTNGGA